MGEFLLELWSFMKERKKFWLLPIIICLSAAGEFSGLHLWLCRCAFHLHTILKVHQVYGLCLSRPKPLRADEF